MTFEVSSPFSSRGAPFPRLSTSDFAAKSPDLSLPEGEYDTLKQDPFYSVENAVVKFSPLSTDKERKRRVGPPLSILFFSSSKVGIKVTLPSFRVARSWKALYVPPPSNTFERKGIE